MAPFYQLFRQPARFIAVLLLLSLSVAFFCLSGGVFASAQNTLNEIEHNYTTIAVPTSELVTTELDSNMFSTSIYFKEPISNEMWQYMDTLANDKAFMRGAYSQKFISAYSPSISSVTSAQTDGDYNHGFHSSYNRAIFVIRVISVTTAEEKEYTHGKPEIFAVVTATIEEIVRLHPDYQPRETLHIHLTCDSWEDYNALELAPGRRYLLNGEYFIDEDLSLRTDIASLLRLPFSKVDLADIRYDLSEPLLAGFKKGDPDYPVAYYATKDETMKFLSSQDIEMINACRITPSYMDPATFSTPFIAADGSYTGLTVGTFYTNASLIPLDTDWKTFIESNPEWQLALQEVETQYHTFPVIGTDLLESLYTFHQKESFVTEGRSFTDDEYQSGSNVCLISESTAQASNLHVGDEIDLSFYWGIFSSFTVSDNFPWQPQPEPYSAKLGFTGDAKRYKIIGIYRQTNLWDTTGYSFTPNTVFVPAASLDEYCFTSRRGAMFTYVLQNGKVQEFQDALAAGGFPTNLVFCFDGGYAEIADTLNGFYKSAAQLFIAACATCLAAVLVYLALFVNRQKRTMGLMLSLGAGRKRATWFGCRIAILPIVIATILGAAVGLLVMNATVQSLLSSVSEVMDTTMSTASALGHATTEAAISTTPAAVPLAALAQCLLASLLAALSIARITRKPPLELIRKG